MRDSRFEDLDIRIVSADEDVQRCYPVIAQLRPELIEEEFLATFRRVEQGGYELARMEKNGEIVAVAGFRVTETFMPYRFLYVFELVTAEMSRGQGIGSRLFDWLVELAKSRGCHRLQLDSAHFRTDAHRFYLHKGMKITRHYFDFEIPGNAQ